jgi:hypothetical protein
LSLWRKSSETMREKEPSKSRCRVDPGRLALPVE